MKKYQKYKLWKNEGNEIETSSLWTWVEKIPAPFNVSDELTPVEGTPSDYNFIFPQSANFILRTQGKCAFRG